MRSVTVRGFGSAGVLLVGVGNIVEEVNASENINVGIQPERCGDKCPAIRNGWVLTVPAVK